MDQQSATLPTAQNNYGGGQTALGTFVSESMTGTLPTQNQNNNSIMADGPLNRTQPLSDWVIERMNKN